MGLTRVTPSTVGIGIPVLPYSEVRGRGRREKKDKEEEDVKTFLSTHG